MSSTRWKGALQQYAGRLHRLHYAKREVIIYNYVEANIPIARRMFAKRKKGYAAVGYELEDTRTLNLSQKYHIRMNYP